MSALDDGAGSETQCLIIIWEYTQVQHQTETTTKYLKVVWMLSLLALVLPPALLLMVFALNYAGHPPEGIWAWNAVMVTPAVCLVVSGLIFLIASAMWLSNRLEFSHVRRTMGISAVGLVIDYLAMAFIFSRYVRF